MAWFLALFSEIISLASLLICSWFRVPIFEILLKGYQTIYLGESIPTESLLDLKNYYEKITFVSYLTVEPNQDEIDNYISDIQTKLLDNTNHELLLLGRLTQFITSKTLSKNIHIFNSIEELSNTL